MQHRCKQLGSIHKEAASKEAASKDAASKDAASKEAASKDAAYKDAASKEAASKDAASKEAASKDAASKDARCCMQLLCLPASLGAAHRCSIFACLHAAACLDAAWQQVAARANKMDAASVLAAMQSQHFRCIAGFRCRIFPCWRESGGKKRKKRKKARKESPRRSARRGARRAQEGEHAAEQEGEQGGEQESLSCSLLERAHEAAPKGGED